MDVCPAIEMERVAERRGRPPRVLVVEDDWDQRLAIRDGLLRTGFSVDTASDGCLAAEMLSVASYDFLISDISLPGLSGIELARIVSDFCLPPFIILITGYPEWYEQVQECVLVMRKPVSLRLLKNILKDLASGLDPAATWGKSP